MNKVTSMKQFKFLGDPTKYQWDFPLERGMTYTGDVKVFGANTLQKVMEWAQDPHDPEFEKEWEEVSGE